VSLANKKFKKPVPISTEISVEEYSSGNGIMDSWLRKRALKNQKGNFTRTFVVLDEDDKLAGYYSLSSASLSHDNAASNLRRNGPNPIPAIRLGQISISVNYQGKKLSRALLRDAFTRVKKVSDDIGAKALILNAIDEEAESYWEYIGFARLPNNTDFYLKISDIQGGETVH